MQYDAVYTLSSCAADFQHYLRCTKSVFAGDAMGRSVDHKPVIRNGVSKHSGLGCTL